LLVSYLEQKYAGLVLPKRCLATANGITALFVCHALLGVDAGDEVLVSPYTFATYGYLEIRVCRFCKY
jgi:dTDP-4-amino-4,6-dideoxygalactose transaminase